MGFLKIGKANGPLTVITIIRPYTLKEKGLLSVNGLNLFKGVISKKQGGVMAKKLLIAAIGFVAATCFAEATLSPISAAVKRVNWNKPDPLELSYLGLRCGALNGVIGAAMEYQGDGSAQTKRTEAVYKADGDMFRDVGFYFGFAGQQGDKYMLKQYEDLFRFYGKEWQDNLRLNNMPWTPLIKGDVASCESIKPTFEAFKQAIDIQDARAKRK